MSILSTGATSSYESFAYSTLRNTVGVEYLHLIAANKGYWLLASWRPYAHFYTYLFWSNSHAFDLFCWNSYCALLQNASFTHSAFPRSCHELLLTVSRILNFQVRIPIGISLPVVHRDFHQLWISRMNFSNINKTLFTFVRFHWCPQIVKFRLATKLLD